MKTVTSGLLLLGLLSLCLASSDRVTDGRLRLRRALQQDEEHGGEERSVTARAEVVRTPAGTPVQKNFSEVAFNGQCNFSLSSGLFVPGGNESVLTRDRFNLGPYQTVGDHIQVTDTTKYPFSAIGRLFATSSYNNTSGVTKDFPYSLAACTGTLISPRHVLTASHCLVHFKAQPGSFAAQNLYGDDRIDMGQIVFAPGLARPCRDPFGISYVVKTRVPRNYVRCNNINNDLGCTSWDHDYALLTLDKDIGNDVGYMAVANPEEAPPREGDRLYLGGYGDDHVNNEYVDGWVQRVSNCTYIQAMAENTTEIDFLDCEAAQGESGGPIWKVDANGTRRLTGTLHGVGNLALLVRAGLYSWPRADMLRGDPRNTASWLRWWAGTPYSNFSMQVMSTAVTRDVWDDVRAWLREDGVTDAVLARAGPPQTHDGVPSV